jgi:glycosyltransferase involved in cell wall biosynthesis
MLTDLFPELSETFIRAEAHAMETLGTTLRIEAVSRAERPDRRDAGALDARFLEDDGAADKVRDLLWLMRRAPLGCLGDLAERRRWRREEWPVPLRALAPMARRISRHGDQHLHAHFGSGAALNALRVGRLLGLPYSVTVHGYDIFQTPRNLREKLERAAFATSGSDYTVEFLRREYGPAAERTFKIVMGVDGDAWRRSAPPSPEPFVLAIGRLVEKKGLTDLLRAAVQLGEAVPAARIAIVGEGPQRAELEALHAELGLGERVEFLGARSPGEIRALLERAACLAVPCVIAPDGDRDSMPVVAKEALAMEVPVVASDACGLPEVVHPEWGRLVPAGDAGALGAALIDVLSLPPHERGALGAAGRAYVIEAFSVLTETGRLLAMIGDVVAGREPIPPPAPGRRPQPVAGPAA